ncbi:Dehydrogenase xptC [Lachnellula suecica]|uniref:Dehydrogenase xptC n=1 Tax=Lachnellula suecica TaxID=602035 RepID=A0A8T9CHL7_9HELO|nr:Dehydrogenase xptC [Lachnellula suecica]
MSINWSARGFPLSASNSSNIFDFIVIGGGTAGLAVATRISQGLNNSRILVLEAGPDGRNEPGISVPGRKGSTIGTKYDWNLTSVPQVNISNRKISMTRGKVLGGSSALNLMTWDRASVADYDAWEKLGNPGWNWKNMISAMLKVENFFPSSEYGVEGVGHGGQALGISQNLQSLNGTPLGVMRQPSNIRKEDYTQPYSPAYLSLASSNLVVRTDTRVAKIDFDGKTAIGITLENGAIMSATKEVILSAGSLLSPGLLEVSGIGQRSLLKSKGLDVVYDLPGVGENLHDNIRIQTSYKLKPEYLSFDELRFNATFAAEQLALYNDQQPSWYDYTGSGYAYMTWDQVTAQVQPAQSFLSLAEEVADETSPQVPQLEVIFSDGYTGVKGYPTINSTLYGSEFFTLIAAVQHPFSKGSVHINSSSLSIPPIINPNYLSNDYDLQAIITAAKYARLLASTAPLSSVWITEYEPGPVVSTDEDWLAFARNTTLSIYHPVGTCAMLPESYDGVVDSELRVYGVERLRVVDSSIMPILPSAHIQTAVYGIAERAAELITLEPGRTQAKFKPTRPIMSMSRESVKSTFRNHLAIESDQVSRDFTLLQNGPSKDSTRFSDLSMEIRCMIWTYAMPKPRIVAICGGPVDTGVSCYYHSVAHKVPVVLHINHESRKEALKHYRLSFGSLLNHSPIYFDFTRDTLLFPSRHTADMFFKQNRTEIVDPLPGIMRPEHANEKVKRQTERDYVQRELRNLALGQVNSWLDLLYFEKCQKLKVVALSNYGVPLMMPGFLIQRVGTGALVPSDPARKLSDMLSRSAQKRFQSDFELPEIQNLEAFEFAKRYCTTLCHDVQASFTGETFDRTGWKNGHTFGMFAHGHRTNWVV